jgi:tRNA threonylcarbamoyladenosine biosynthesis protein TsaB
MGAYFLPFFDPTRAEVLSAASYAKFLNKGKVTFIGNGVEKWQKIAAHTKASFRSGILPSAQNMGILANELFLKNEFVDVAYFEPYYLKDFQTFKSQ